MDPEIQGLRFVAVDVHFRVEGGVMKSVLVDDVVLVDQKAAVALRLAGEVAADSGYAARVQFGTGEIVEAALNRRHEGKRIEGLALGAEGPFEVADKYLSGQRFRGESREFDGGIADDVFARTPVQPLDLEV